MVEIKNVDISKNTCKTGEKIIISVEVKYYLTYPYKYPYNYSDPEKK